MTARYGSPEFAQEVIDELDATMMHLISEHGLPHQKFHLDELEENRAMLGRARAIHRQKHTHLRGFHVIRPTKEAGRG